MPHAREVAVTGIGMITPGGPTAEETWRAVCEGRSLARTDPELAGLPVDISCRIDGFDATASFGRPLARRLDRFTHLSLDAARQAVTDAKLDPAHWPRERVGVVLGVGSNSLETYVREFTLLGEGRPRAVSPMALPRSVPSMVPAEVALDLQVHGPSFSVASACASGATAIGVARDLLLAGTCDIVLAGGADSGRARMTATCFAQMTALSRRTDDPSAACRPFDVDRDGLVLSEGAAVLVLERPDDARARGAHIRALLRGYGSSSDAHHPVAPHPDGAGAERALRAALADAGCVPGDVDHVNAHGTSTPAGDTAEALALLRTFDGTPPPVTSTKSVLGHALGASAAVEAALTVLTLQQQHIPPTANLHRQHPAQELDIVTAHPRPTPIDLAATSSFGFGGQNTVLILTKP
ncbi:beta-ketoacyl-[acyl-carrier-protein] synthase family protein [Streptomyces sp. NPDC091279]|uniref:beta-ketoacyl-[acyl-carrier-protein] synthase family protein n=1 Tax=unclassified Streptomyces TaxID=2593676 RepID=UPI00380334CF